MAQKHLKELLKEDQEPFQLDDYIAYKQCQLKKQPERTQIQLKKPKPVSKNTQFFCKNACFFSLQNSPDPRKSPLFDFASSVKSPNRVFLQVPAKTAALLLEAAMRIQKPKNQTKNSGFGLFGSILKRLTSRNRTRKVETGEERETEDEKNRGGEIIEQKLRAPAYSSSSSSSSSSSCSNNGRQSSLELESSSSARSIDEEEDEDEGFEFRNVVRENGCDLDYGLCLSPLSPFRFALHTSPSPDRRRSPVFSSPAKSPVRCKIEDNAKHEQGSPVKFQEEDDDEEDKEQNSPVSVLDRPFEDDDYDGNEEDSYGVECNYSFVQRAKQHLLHKLHKFESLSDLDPIELEKRMIEEEDKNCEEPILDQAEDYQEYEYESFSFEEQRRVDEFIEETVTKSGFQDMKKPGMKRLICDLVEEESVENALEISDDKIIKRVCKRLESWKEVESNTIDMMVEMDLSREISEWKKPHEQIRETTRDIEVAIFRVLVEELLEDLSYSS